REGHPLGRVEWVKLFGALLGLEDNANSYFNEQVTKVNNVTAAEKNEKNVAIFYMSTDAQKVYARNGGDYMAQMIELAGGTYIMADVSPEKSGTTATTLEELYARCVDADYLFYVNFALKFDSIDEMVKQLPLLADFKAVKEGRVYITAPIFTQSTAAIGGIIEDMNSILIDPGIESTQSLIKLK
ncbi:MAG: ABC transporter substrate-binding protein, partial [Clostridiales bacterium]|nr:ABC transporter substrate-binding protein [Clostridiales bacterium]